jgi:hypothetical protein
MIRTNSGAQPTIPAISSIEPFNPVQPVNACIHNVLPPTTPPALNPGTPSDLKKTHQLVLVVVG